MIPTMTLTNAPLTNQHLGTWRSLDEHPLNTPGMLVALANPLTKQIVVHRVQGQILGPTGSTWCLLQELPGYQEPEVALHVWELGNRGMWVVARTEAECWDYMLDQNGDEDEIRELRYEEGEIWSPMASDRRLTISVDEEGHVCAYDDGTPLTLPAWIWAKHHGVGFLAEEE